MASPFDLTIIFATPTRFSGPLQGFPGLEKFDSRFNNKHAAETVPLLKLKKGSTMELGPSRAREF